MAKPKTKPVKLFQDEANRQTTFDFLAEPEPVSTQPLQGSASNQAASDARPGPTSTSATSPDEFEDDEYDAEALASDLNETDAEDEPATPRLAEQTMFAALLAAAARASAPDDPVLLDYVDKIADCLSLELALVSAKGGESFIAARLAEGKTEADVARYRQEQSLRAHLINGLLPASHVARQLQAWDAPRFGRFDERAYRLFCAGFTLHDWLKLPEVEQWLENVGLTHSTVNAAQNLSLVEEIFRQWVQRLRLDAFLEPIGGVELWLHDLIYLACNTQVRWDTMLNLAALPRLALDGRTRQLATDLCTLADYLAYIAPTPREAAANRPISEMLSNLSDGTAWLAYHHVAETRGVITNFIHNAALRAMQSADCVPLLYAPSGVVYLTRTNPRGGTDEVLSQLAEDVVLRIRRACVTRLRSNLTGFSRDGKGLKYAPYYDLHFSAAGLIELAGKAVFVRISENKTAVAGTRFAKMREKEMAPPGTDLDLPNDIRVDQLAEFCAKAASIVADEIPRFDATALLLAELGLSHERSVFMAITAFPRSGGVAYNWYYIAGVYLKRGDGRGATPEDWRMLINRLSQRLGQAIDAAQDRAAAAESTDGWDDVRRYVKQVLTFGPQQSPTAVDVRTDAAAELARYTMAKAQGRGATKTCSLCSSAFAAINPQREAGIPFAPQVYSNKLPLHGAKAIRNICRLCEVEMMLRQILMSRDAASGKRFEGRRVRYLYIYPTYFFTPETLQQVRNMYYDLKQLSFTSIRRALLDETSEPMAIHMTGEDYQHLGPLMQWAQAPPPEHDRLLRMQFPQDEPITFFFLGMPAPGRDPKDAEAWINPAFLALALPLALDVKVVATESLVPLLHEANDLIETVFMDAPHDFVRDIIGRERITLEGLLLRLQALTATYFVHLDGNADLKKGEYRWHALPPLARKVTTDAKAVFAYLKKWQRSQKNLDAVPPNKAHLYLQLATILDQLKGGDSMSHARELTARYMRFYRAKRTNSNSILRPMAIAAQSILHADARLFDREGLVEAVRGNLRSFMERVQAGSADGRLAPGSDWRSREEGMQQFAEYFVGDVFYDALRGDRAALRGKQLNLLKNACEVIYRDQTAQEWRNRQTTEPNEED